MTVFHKLPTGATFHRGKHNAGFPREGLAWCEYRKESKSRAVCTKQINYGNTRAEGNSNPIPAQEKVFEI